VGVASLEGDADGESRVIGGACRLKERPLALAARSGVEVHMHAGDLMSLAAVFRPESRQRGGILMGIGETEDMVKCCRARHLDQFDWSHRAAWGRNGQL